MTGRAFVDTNVLVYLFDRDAGDKRRRARALLESEGPSLVLSTQVLQEFYVTVTRKLGWPMSEPEAERAVRDLARLDVAPIDPPLVLQAISLSRQQRLSLWDALIVESARSRSCARLLTEDLQHGMRFGDLTIENPFA